MDAYKEVSEFETEATSFVSAALSTAIASIERRARHKFLGRMVTFKHRWHFLDEWTPITAPISGVVVSADQKGDVSLEFIVTLLNPRTGRGSDVGVHPYNCEMT